MKSMASLKYNFGIKIRCYPNYQQRANIKLNADKSRFFYNHQIAIDKYLYDIKCYYGLRYYYNPLIKQWCHNIQARRSFKYLKSCYSFLWNKKIDSLSMARAWNNHNRAWQNYRNGLQGIPQFHAKKQHPYEDKYQTACLYHKNKHSNHIGNIRLLDKYHLRLPKLKTIRLAYVRPFLLHKHDYRIGTTTIQKDNLGHYYVSLTLASDTPFVDPKPFTHQKLGYDLNTSDFLMDSNGNKVANPRYYRHQLHRLTQIQKVVSRRYRHNQGRNLRNCLNYQAMRIKLAQLSQHVKQQRTNFLQTLSTELIESQDFLVGEELRSSNMLKNHHLAQSIADVGWREFIGMLTYKANLYHKQFITVDPKYTTQTCHDCGYIMRGNQKLTLNDRQWTCPQCHHNHNRDWNSAKNILAKGLAKVK